jgi:hypothetical protein
LKALYSIVVDVGTIVSRLMQMTRGGSASVVGAAVVSAVLTAAVALPMGANALDAAADPAGLHDDIALSDTRFPAPVPLDDDQLEVLEREPEILAGPVAEEPEATATEAPTSRPAEATPTPTTGDEDEPEEFAIIFPTPTTEAPPTPRPIPTPAPAPPTPLAPTPTPTATATPEPSPSPDLDEPTPTEVPESTPDPTPEPGDMPSTDVYAYVTGDPLVENEVGSLDVKAVNGGSAATTEVTMTVSMAGARILSVTPQRGDWTCSGGGASWSCSGPDLEAEAFSRGIMSVLPNGDDDVTVSVSVSHGIMDEAPGNNSLQATVPVVPDRDPDPGGDGFDDDFSDDGGGFGDFDGDDFSDDGSGFGDFDGDDFSDDGGGFGDLGDDGSSDGTDEGGGFDDAGTDGDPTDPGSDGASSPSANPGTGTDRESEPTRPTDEADSATRAAD